MYNTCIAHKISLTSSFSNPHKRRRASHATHKYRLHNKMMKSRGWNNIRAGESKLLIIDYYFFENVKLFEDLSKARPLRMARNARDQNVYFETGYEHPRHSLKHTFWIFQKPKAWILDDFKYLSNLASKQIYTWNSSLGAVETTLQWSVHLQLKMVCTGEITWLKDIWLVWY